MFAQGPRPNTADLNCLAILKNTLAELKLENLCVVFTKCDTIKPNKPLKPGERRFDLEYADEWYNYSLRKYVKEEGPPKVYADTLEGIPEIPQDRILLFAGEDGGPTPMTTKEELFAFIEHCLPKAELGESATHANNFQYDRYLETVKTSSNPELVPQLNMELDLLKEYMKSQ